MKRMVACSGLLVFFGCLAWGQGKGRISNVMGAAPAVPQARGGMHGGMQGGVRRAPGRPGGGFSVPPGRVTVAPTPFFPNTYGSPHGYGNVVFPGTGHAPGTFSPFGVGDLSFGSRLANTVGGFGFGTGFGGFGHGFGRRGQPVVIPYAVPVYIPYSEPQPPQVVVPPPQVIYLVPGEPDRNLTTSAPAPQQTQSVVTYVVPPRYETPQAGEKKLYLIAFKNHSIYSATDYWLEDDTLHYVTPYGAHNQASLDQVDLEFTTRLNRERGVEFRLEQRQP